MHRLMLATLTLTLPALAHAHPGHVHTLMDLFTHALTELDHLLLALLAAGGVALVVRAVKNRLVRV